MSQKVLHWAQEDPSESYFMEIMDEASGAFTGYENRDGDGIAPLKRDPGFGVIMTNKIECGY